ncbi:TetR/AcrR family transcriptional regulator [Nocardioides nitrophenolicus]|uniref:TetR/AcrR family transcriptional regulator n=1 Tax=Nocardioides nitrophenolicus TaxID=60489 RepID=UPI00195A07C1|nr:TetR/AcrR family transcriptional regulator C-terminal domain-containing protein [Nocardioides nitrophenolicus]MBM7519085.1 AcrR family transcriptional regulator [Nocardioides nitrophenolicus]
MPGRPRTTRRATHSLDQIVDAAIAMLDREGAGGLTLRGLAAELGGGLGSVYWYVAGKAELLDLACDTLVGRALEAVDVPTPPMEVELDTDDPVVLEAAATVRRISLALFAQIDEHPWLAGQSQLGTGNRPNGLRVWEQVGRALATMGLSPRQQFHGSTAITGYVGGVGAAMAAQDEAADLTLSKEEQFDRLVARWQGEEYDELPWIRSMTEQFRRHDDLAQFAAGLDLLILGLVRQAVRPGKPGRPARG